MREVLRLRARGTTSQAGGFPGACVFCGGPLLSLGARFWRADGSGDSLYSCQECGLYLICAEAARLLVADPARRQATSFLVREAAGYGLLPRLCVRHEGFERIPSPFVRALQKCPICRKEPPRRLAAERFVHPGDSPTPCRASQEWETVFETPG